jgi:hypothetical protein
MTPFIHYLYEYGFADCLPQSPRLSIRGTVVLSQAGYVMTACPRSGPAWPCSCQTPTPLQPSVRDHAGKKNERAHGKTQSSVYPAM